MTTFPLAPADCDSPDPGGVVPAICLPAEDTGPAPMLAEVIGNDHGHLLGGGAMDTAFGHLGDAPTAPSGALDAIRAADIISTPWYSTLTPGAAVALITITVALLAVAALIGWGIHTAKSAR